MAHTKHRKKTHRKSEQTRLANRATRSDMRTAIKKVKAAEPAEVDVALSAAAKRLDKAAKGHLIHPNKAARTKSRLAKAANKAKAAS